MPYVLCLDFVEFIERGLYSFDILLEHIKSIKMTIFGCSEEMDSLQFSRFIWFFKLAGCFEILWIFSEIFSVWLL